MKRRILVLLSILTLITLACGSGAKAPQPTNTASLPVGATWEPRPTSTSTPVPTPAPTSTPIPTPDSNIQHTYTYSEPFEFRVDFYPLGWGVASRDVILSWRSEDWCLIGPIDLYWEPSVPENLEEYEFLRHANATPNPVSPENTIPHPCVDYTGTDGSDRQMLKIELFESEGYIFLVHKRDGLKVYFEVWSE